MGGKVSVESVPGVGSTFWFTARLGRGGLEADDEDAGRAAVSAEAELCERHVGAGLLLAEDNEINQEVALEILQRVGLLVEIASDGGQAVAMAREKSNDLILMDMQMSVMNGLDATRVIRRLAGHESVPILAMTANAFDEDRLLCLEAGMNDFVAKPVDPPTMYATTLKWLRTRKAQAATLPASQRPAAGGEGWATRLYEIRGFDPDLGLRVMRGIWASYVRVLKLLVESGLESHKRLGECLSGGDMAEFRRVAHDLKGSAGVIGAVRICELATDLNALIKRGVQESEVAGHCTARRLELAELTGTLQPILSAAPTYRNVSPR